MPTIELDFLVGVPGLDLEPLDSLGTTTSVPGAAVNDVLDLLGVVREV